MKQQERRTFQPETIEDIGASFWCPTWILLCTRALSGLGHLSFGIVILVLASAFPNRLFPWKWLYVLPALVHLMLSVSFLLLASASYMHIRSFENSAIQRTVIPLHHTGVALANFLAFMTALYRYFAERTRTPSVISAILINPFLFSAYNMSGPPATIDFLLGCRLRFRLEYVWLAPLNLAIFTAAVSVINQGVVQFPHAIKFLSRTRVLFASWMIFFHIVCTLIAIIAVPMSYISGLIDQRLKERREQKAIDEAAKEKDESVF